MNLFFAAASSKSLPGWRGRLAALLNRLGPSWRAAPVRRLIQATCLLLYLDLFFYVSWPYAAVFSSAVLPDKEWLPVEVFLWLDPLVGLSTAVAARAWNVALFGLIGILAMGLLFPRGFCGYLCPLGTLIDAADTLLARGRRTAGPRPLGTWANLRFYLLAAILVAAVFGVLLSGFFAAIPVLTRGMLFTGGQLQLGWLKNWSMVPPFSAAVVMSVGLLAGVFVLSLLGPRFWCRYVCPTGALLALPAGWRLARRRVDDHCIHCGKCVPHCPFDAINPDFTTRTLNCTFCQTCGGVCPTQAIHFESRPAGQPKLPGDTPLGRPLSRRAMLGFGLGGAASALAMRWLPAANTPPLRPPGSVPEAQFLDLCIRCEQCLKVCPGPVLQAAAWAHGPEALWTPVAVPTHAGCHQDCNFCTQVCPTGAIRPLELEEKRRTRMGLAEIDPELCLPHAGERDCQLCFNECQAAGYDAIEMREIQLPVGQVPAGSFSPEEIEAMSRILAPFVNADACVGCGLCEYRCHTAMHRQQGLLPRSAVVTQAVNPQTRIEGEKGRTE